jgi:membrane-associated phospholipid phosphatase
MLIRKKLWALALLAVVFSLVSIQFWDQALALWLEEIQIERFYRIYRTLTDAGEAIYYFLFAILGLGGSWVALRFFPASTAPVRPQLSFLKERSLFLFVSLLSSGIVLHFFKFLFGRQRPHVSEDFQSDVFVPFNTHWHYHSMPSGHSQTLLTVATVLWVIYPKSGWIVFPTALFLAFTRLAMEAHFLSDVIMGSYIGFAVTVLVALRRKLLS